MDEPHVQVETAFFDTFPSECFGVVVVKIGSEVYRCWGVIVPETYCPGREIRDDREANREIGRLIAEINQAVELLHKRYIKKLLKGEVQ